jgi:hypothetical protein
MMMPGAQAARGSRAGSGRLRPAIPVEQHQFTAARQLARTRAVGCRCDFEAEAAW